MKVLLGVLLTIILAQSARAQSPTPPQTAKFDAKHPPRFEDFPVTEKWNQPPAPLKLVTRSERMFRTQLTNAAKEPPDFAGSYRFAGWGCGSACGAGAIIDLKTGIVYPPPLGGKGEGAGRWVFCGGVFEGRYTEYRPDSRLVILRCAQIQPYLPEVYYFVWEDHAFRLVLHLPPNK